MPSKFEGEWQYHFLRITNTGNITRTPMGRFHLPTVENSGTLTNATDDDNMALTGEIGRQGPFETIHINRGAGPERHLRGILAFEGVINGVFCMVLVGERRGRPFPVERRGKDDEDIAALPPGQEDGTWVATKP